MLAKFENGQCQYNPAANRNAIYERFTGDVLPECKGNIVSFFYYILWKLASLDMTTLKSQRC